jgi:hypothetical protein
MMIMGVLFDLLEFCAKNADDDRSMNLDNWYDQYPQYNTDPVIEEDTDKPKSMKLDSE